MPHCSFLQKYSILTQQHPFSIAYFMLGGIVEGFVRKNEPFKLKFKIIGTTILVILAISFMPLSYIYGKYLEIEDIVYDGYQLITTFVITFCIFCAFRINENYKPNKFIKAVASQTMFVYIFHYVAIQYMYKYFEVINVTQVYGLFPSMIIFIVLTGIGYLLTKVKFIKYLFKL